jgi:hypothetical protein
MARPARTFGEASAKEQVQKNPVTEPKRSQNPKRPLPPPPFPNGYSIFENALVLMIFQLDALGQKHLHSGFPSASTAGTLIHFDPL